MKGAYQDLQGTHCGGRHHSKLKVFKISRRPSHPTVTFILILRRLFSLW